MMRRINLVLVLPLFAAAAYAQNEPRLSLPPAKTSDIELAFGFARAGVPSGADPHRYFISNEVMIRWSEANDTAWGFSKLLGRWAKQEINPPADQSPWTAEPRTIFVGDNVAVWRVGSSYYAYSGQTGRWDVLRLPEGRAPKPLLGDNLVFVNDTDNDYAFAASTGRWSSPKDSAASTRDDAAAEGQPDGTVIKVFTLRHAKAIDAQVLINQLFARDIHSAAADERSNTLIVRGPAEQLNIIFAILTRLDELEPPGPAKTSNAAAWPKPVTTATVAERAKQFETKEAQAATLARQIREQQSGGKGDKAKIDKLTADLRKVIGEVFSARQELHRAEAAQLQQRIAGILKNVVTRDRLSDQIIDHRLKDLLNPDLQWESASRPPTTMLPSSTRTSTQPATAPHSELRYQSGFEAVPVNWQHALADSIIWNVLHVKVQAVTPQSVSKYGYKGGLLVDEAGPALEPKELRAGDVILGLHHWEAKSIGDLAWILLQPVSKGVSVLNPEARSTSETAAIHILRDGKVTTKEITLPPWSPESSKSSAERAGQQTRRGNPSAAAQASSSPPTLNLPTLNLPLGDKSTTIRSAADFNRALREAENSLFWTKDESIRNQKQRVKTPERMARDVADAESRLSMLREEYSAQIRLLELELQDAASALEIASQQRKLAQDRFDGGESPRDAILPHDRAVQESTLRLQRAKTLLDLYRKADPKNSPSPPAPEPAAAPATDPAILPTPKTAPPPSP